MLDFRYSHLRLSRRPKYNLALVAIISGALALSGIYLVFRSHAATNNADFNSDNIVNITDLSVLASHYNTTGQSHATGDANGDGSVNITDLSILAAQWGTNPGGGTAADCGTYALPGGVGNALTGYPCPLNTGNTSPPAFTLNVNDVTRYGCNRTEAQWEAAGTAARANGNGSDAGAANPCPGRPWPVEHDQGTGNIGFMLDEGSIGTTNGASPGWGHESCNLAVPFPNGLAGAPVVISGWEIDTGITVGMTNGTHVPSSPCVTFSNDIFTVINTPPFVGADIGISPTSVCGTNCGPVVITSVLMSGHTNFTCQNIDLAHVGGGPCPTPNYGGGLGQNVGGNNFYIYNSDLQGAGDPMQTNTGSQPAYFEVHNSYILADNRLADGFGTWPGICDNGCGAHMDPWITNGVGLGSKMVLDHSTWLCAPADPINYMINNSNGCSVSGFASYGSDGLSYGLTVNNNFFPPGDVGGGNCIDLAIGDTRGFWQDTNEGLYTQFTNNVFTHPPAGHTSGCDNAGGFSWASSSGPGVNVAGNHTGNYWCNNQYVSPGTGTPLGPVSSIYENDPLTGVTAAKSAGISC